MVCDERPLGLSSIVSISNFSHFAIQHAPWSLKDQGCFVVESWIDTAEETRTTIK